jgi:hypothetical protein
MHQVGHWLKLFYEHVQATGSLPSGIDEEPPCNLACLIQLIIAASPDEDQKAVV